MIITSHSHRNMENFFTHTQNWINGEIVEGIAVSAFGIITVIAGIFLLNMDKVPAARTLFLPLVICGAAYTAIGASLYFSNRDREEKYAVEYHKDGHAFLEKEKQRVEGFQYMYTISKAVATVFFLLTIVIFWLTTSPQWQAAGIGLTLFGLAGLVVDFFSQHRAQQYYDALQKALNG